MIYFVLNYRNDFFMVKNGKNWWHKKCSIINQLTTDFAGNRLSAFVAVPVLLAVAGIGEHFVTERAFEFRRQMIVLAVLTKGTGTGESALAQFTLERFRSRVGVHVQFSVPFQTEHFGTEIAFEAGRFVDLAVMVKGIWSGEGL